VKFCSLRKKLYFEENPQIVVWMLLLEDEVSCSFYSIDLCNIKRSSIDI